MKDSVLRLTLREMRVMYGSSKVWFGLAAAAILLTITGPFETLSAFSIIPRLAYWIAMTLTTFSVGAFVSGYMTTVSRRYRPAPFRRFLMIECVTGLAITLVVLFFNFLVLGLSMFRLDYLSVVALNVFAISVTITAAIEYLSRKPATPETTRILSRLDIDKRGAIISLSVQDHYVEVVTTKGASLVLMRLSDAIAEVQGTQGLQTHRSHWVAVDHVAMAKRIGDKGVIITSDGRDIPISRTYLKAVREAGLLPK